MIFLLQ